MVLCDLLQPLAGQCRDQSSCETARATPESLGLLTRGDRLPYGGVPVPCFSSGRDDQENVYGQTLSTGCTLHNVDTTGGPRENGRDHCRNSSSPDCAQAGTCGSHNCNGGPHSRTNSPHFRTTCHRVLAP